VTPTFPDCENLKQKRGGVMVKEMEVVIPVCCGVDIHKEVAVCCLRKTEGEGVKSEVRSFSTMTGELKELKEWLMNAGVTHVAVESTGVYWKPLFNILEDSMTVVLANARHVKHVPGRKTDVKDCEWLAKLLQCGLIQGSFIPPKLIRELRDLTRYRRKILGHLASEKNRIQKVLEDANIKLSSVATDVFGVSGMEILKALTDGETEGEELAKLAIGKLKGKIPQLEKALTGHVSKHHLFMIKRSLEHMAYIQKSVKQVDREIEKKLKPYKEDYERLQTIPGVKETGAASIIAEIGVEMSQFPTVEHLSSWAGICPGNNESAGKKKVERCGQEMFG
jgi:transposase